MSLLSDFNKKVVTSFKKANDQIIFDPNERHEVISSGSLAIDMDMDGGLAIVGRLVELVSFECLTADTMVRIRINKNLPNTSQIINIENVL